MESGNHQELLAKKGLYYHLYELQYKHYGFLGKGEFKLKKKNILILAISIGSTVALLLFLILYF